ncbi:MAG TPA: AMP-binding protein [Terracidiphilus sp.]|jgi:acyl-CoA synthetase (AMP-forming)/AMP-acid ligase II/thioesterase domain-containing protein/acyl carrier protein|nr:AMP-binding protein [Terracidiphilus sp.]
MHRSLLAGLKAVADFAEASPRETALLEPGGMLLSYGELWGYLEAVHTRLLETGISSEDTVAVLVPQGIFQVMTVMGVLSHCVCAPLPPKTVADEVAVSLKKLSAKALIVAPEFEAEGIAAAATGLIVLNACLAQHPSEWKATLATGTLQTRRASSNVSLLLMTSGTTGTSKVVQLTGTNLDAGTAARRDSLKLEASDRQLLMTSLSHIIGIENTLAQFVAGGVVIATGGFDPKAYLGWLEEWKPTWYDCAPAVHQAALVQLRSETAEKPVSLRFVQSAGAPLPQAAKDALERILHVPVFNDYGMTEACPIAVDAFLGGDRVPKSAGRSCGLEIGIFGKSGEQLVPGRDGEIAVRGAAVFPGYLGDVEASATVFDDGWFRTGDAGHVDADGNLFITGRLKEMINRGGEKVAPGEVDEVIGSHPAVLDAAAFAIPHPTLGEDVACAVVLRRDGGQSVSPSEIRRFAAKHLAPYKIPRRICFVDKIPRGDLGKPQRWQLAQTLNSLPIAAPMPAEQTEGRLADDVFYKIYEIWGRILDREDMGLDEDFFEAGGDSLAAVNMLAEIDERFGVETSALAASFLDQPTLDHLTDLVRAMPHSSRSTHASSQIQIFPIGESNASKRLYCIPSDGNEGLYFRRLAKHLAGKMGLSIVRPASTWFMRSLTTTEDNGKASAARIREQQPEGPYFVGGYCYGGVVALEAARQLWQEGQEVKLVFFDVLMPGYPSPFLDWPTWLERTRAEWKMFRKGEHPKVFRNLRRFVRRIAWAAAVATRGWIAPATRQPWVMKFLHQAEKDYFPFYKARAIDVPILHFICTDTPSAVDQAALLGWRQMARCGIEEKFVPLDHSNVLHESNLPTIVAALQKWCGIQAYKQ